MNKMTLRNLCILHSHYAESTNCSKAKHTEANALLIAAAPDLLAAAEGAEQELTAWLHGNTAVSIEGNRDRLRAAIRAAKGE